MYTTSACFDSLCSDRSAGCWSSGINRPGGDHRITLGVLVALVIIEFLGLATIPVASGGSGAEIDADAEVSDAVPPAEPVLTGSQVSRRIGSRVRGELSSD